MRVGKRVQALVYPSFNLISWIALQAVGTLALR